MPPTPRPGRRRAARVRAARWRRRRRGARGRGGRPPGRGDNHVTVAPLGHVQPESHTVAAWATYGCSLEQRWQQPGSTYGCSLEHMRLQPGAYRIERVGRDAGPRGGARAIYVQDDVEQVEGREAQLAPG
eukprot:scaffold13590_cov66-Phaeocystis_antarctica.AAC.1